jgi:ABC-2 type transport system ATP-binding protein
MNACALQISGVRRRFGQTLAIDGIDLEVKAGERVALLGPNGAGKTTLIRAIAGLARIDEGEIKLFGAAASDETRSRIGLVPQDLAIADVLTAEENLRLFGRINRVPRSELGERIETALQWTGLAGRRRDITRGFSGGMKRRLNIACGVLHQPALVLLDEPTVGVDPQSRARIHDMLDELHARGTTLLLTTHMMEEAAKSMDRIIVIDHGRMVADGNLASLVKSCFGTGRQVKVMLSEEATTDTGDWQVDGRVLERTIENSAQLSDVLRLLADEDFPIEGIEVKSPTLEDVFLHLTGRALRE